MAWEGVYPYHPSLIVYAFAATLTQEGVALLDGVGVAAHLPSIADVLIDDARYIVSDAGAAVAAPTQAGSFDALAACVGSDAVV